MLLRMSEEGMRIDEILFCDTGLEFDEMYKHVDKVEQYIGRSITRLKAKQSFEYYLLEYTPKRKNPELEGRKGLSWAGPRKRWCTAVLKQRVINEWLREYSKKYELIQYIGIAADEPKRIREFNYPLVEWGMTEADCLAYCKDRGFDWGGLYEIFQRVSCWCCPLQSLEELRRLRKYFPEYWERLKELDNQTWRTFLKNYSVEQLETRFALEETWLSAGLSVRSKAFFNALREKLQEGTNWHESWKTLSPAENLRHQL